MAVTGKYEKITPFLLVLCIWLELKEWIFLKKHMQR